MSTNNSTQGEKLVAIQTTLRLHVPADMSEDQIKKFVSNLTTGDFAIYPDSAKGSLKEEIIDHINVNSDKETEEATKRIKDVDLWSENSSYEIINL